MLSPSAVWNKDKRKTGSFFDAQYCVMCDKPFFYNQPRPQGAFPWLREKRPGDEVVLQWMQMST